MMNEQTGANKDAAENYEQAWKYSRKNQPTIGNDLQKLLRCILRLKIKNRKSKYYIHFQASLEIHLVILSFHKLNRMAYVELVLVAFFFENKE